MPSYDEVLGAVNSYYSEEGLHPASAATFRDWGPAAVPHLRKIAEAEELTRGSALFGRRSSRDRFEGRGGTLHRHPRWQDFD